MDLQAKMLYFILVRRRVRAGASDLQTFYAANGGQGTAKVFLSQLHRRGLLEKKEQTAKAGTGPRRAVFFELTSKGLEQAKRIKAA